MLEAQEPRRRSLIVHDSPSDHGDTGRYTSCGQTASAIVVADDNALLREGIAALLVDAGHTVVGRAVDADDLMLKVRSYEPGRGDRRRPHAARERGRRSRCRRRDPQHATPP